MTHLQRGLFVAAIHVVIVSSLGAKLLLDRHYQPRVWAKALPYDPELPIRGRYVSLQLETRLLNEPSDGLTRQDRRVMIYAEYNPAALSVENGQLVARIIQNSSPVHVGKALQVNTFFLGEPVAYFIPPYVPDPSIRQNGEELWVEVTVPKKGPPRPIRLGVKKNGVITPLPLQ